MLTANTGRVSSTSEQALITDVNAAIIMVEIYCFIILLPFNLQS